MTELFAFEIPDKHFAPHKVTKPFYAKVAYSITAGKVHISEVSFSETCLKYIRVSTSLMNEIREAIEEKYSNGHVDETIMNALAPHII